ncbi:MAG: hypothetical protein OXT06_27880, partial [Rhodospirillaceae bacterium]|nr:hypothetical protein [Rhodospirillaceae bacterium]
MIAALASLILSPVFAAIAARHVSRVERRLRSLEGRLRMLEDDDVQPEAPEAAAEPAPAPAAPIDPKPVAESEEPETVAAAAGQPYVEPPASTDEAPATTKSIEER